MDKNVGWSTPGGEPRPSPIASPASHHLPLRSVHAVGLVHHISPGRIRARALAGALLHPIARTIAVVGAASPCVRALASECLRAPSLAGHARLAGPSAGRDHLRRADPHHQHPPAALGAPRTDPPVRLHPPAPAGVDPADRLGGPRPSAAGDRKPHAAVHRRAAGAAPGHATVAGHRRRLLRRRHRPGPGALPPHRPGVGRLVPLPHPRPDPGHQPAHRRPGGGLHQRHAPVLATAHAPGGLRRPHRLGRRDRNRGRPGPPGSRRHRPHHGRRPGARAAVGPLPGAAPARGARARGLPGGLLGRELRPGGGE